MGTSISTTVKVSRRCGTATPAQNARSGLSGVAGKALLTRTEFLQPQAEQALHLKEELAEKVTPWSHENPYLYQLEITLTDSEGEVTEVVPYRSASRVFYFTPFYG